MLEVSEIREKVWEVKLNRPEIHNAFNDELISKITATFHNLSKNEKARLIVLTGEGRSFCAGADLNWMKSMVNYSEEENKADSEKLFDMFASINNCPIPVLGAVNGHALGGGMGLVSVCDFSLTHEKAKFGFTETRLGLIPAVISSFCLGQIGENHARAWFISGEKFSAAQAHQMGLVHEVSSLESFEQRKNDWIESFLQAGPVASRASKRLIKDLKNESDLKKYTCSEIARIRVSKEGQEGMNALLEKRKASWNE
ncbi:MAG: enoyl-CoA hydratase [Halobacteriovoraceae bacterium]|nr:enoyl-CoA hydratase [Halobacteriovoraceae bacterium]|tara:strand:- start:8885 stop:9652 length:768 start_codon:yes stop_codon:yes gene_type:complete